MIKIFPIPALSDNYIWALIHLKKRCCVIVDPGEAKPVLDYLKAHALELTAILITHHHWDHVNGITDILKFHPVPVFGPALEDVPGCTYPVCEPQSIDLPQLEIQLQVLDTPGHTLGHICYFGLHSLFCGDTLFTGGCGRAFEGSLAQLYHSLQKLAQLPDHTLIYCGHEYTQKNLEFALAIEPNNLILRERMALVDELRAQKIATVPSLLKTEKKTNPFLRCEVDSVRQAANRATREELTNPEAVFAVIRELKNKF